MRNLFFYIIIMTMAGPFCSKKNLKAKGCPEEITVTGQILVTGNEPFTSLILSNSDGNYKIIENSESATLRAQYQNHSMQIKGCLFESENKGMIARHKGDIRVISYKSLEDN